MKRTSFGDSVQSEGEEKEDIRERQKDAEVGIDHTDSNNGNLNNFDTIIWFMPYNEFSILTSPLKFFEKF